MARHGKSDLDDSTAGGLLEWAAGSRKAILAFLVSLFGGLAAIMPDSVAGQVLGVLATALVAAGAVYQVANKPKAAKAAATKAQPRPKPQPKPRPTTTEPEAEAESAAAAAVAAEVAGDDGPGGNTPRL